MKQKKVAIIGSRGVPAGYGGFESLVENLIGENCSPTVDYTVFCSSRDLDERRSSYLNSRLRYVGFHANGAQSVIYDLSSMLKALKGFDTLLVLGLSGGIFIPLIKRLSKAKIVVNIDGLEHRRLKWSSPTRRFLKASEAAAVRAADTVIADNKVIAGYVFATYGRQPVEIAYGGDHILRDVTADRQEAILREYDVEKGGYDIAICRIEPENNCEMLLETYGKITRRLLFIGNWDHNSYSQALLKKYSGFSNLILKEATYDPEKLFTLRSNAAVYLHGHSAGGTNPSLVEAMFLDPPVLAFDVAYNRESTFGKARYFSDGASLINLLSSGDLRTDSLKEIAADRYTWEKIAAAYEALY